MSTMCKKSDIDQVTKVRKFLEIERRGSKERSSHGNLCTPGPPEFGVPEQVCPKGSVVRSV